MAQDERVLITCDAESQEVAWQELRAIFSGLPQGEWLDTGDAVQGSILLVESELGFDRFAEQIEEKGSIFVRHLAPAQITFALGGTDADLDKFLQVSEQVATMIDRQRSFAVQSRILGEGKLPYRKVVLNETLSVKLESLTGAEMDCRRPEQIVSVLCTPELAYIGFSLASQNRSDWPGGRHRFKREDDQISRAEFKFLEAESVFGWELPAQGCALDLGASPGGWTRLLALHGLIVDAVDPAELDARLRKFPKVRHVRSRTQDFLSEIRGKPYDVIVNDMKMDARVSVDLLLEARGYLKPKGTALITLKMPMMGHSSKAARTTLGMIRRDLERLASHFEILGARQLYHNRSEVTVLLRSPA